MASGSESPKFVRALRRMRPILTRELPDVAVFLKSPELKEHFTAYEANTVLSQTLPSQRVEKFVEILEFKSYSVYQNFVSVLKVLRTDLAVRLEGLEREVSGASTVSSPGSNGSPEHMVTPVEESLYSHQSQANYQILRENGRENGFVEEAGLYGLSGSATNHLHHLRDLSYAGRQYLAEHLNKDKHIFDQFCVALGVKGRLMQAASRSGNPTAYLLQEYAAREESATFERLELALNCVGKRDLFIELHDKLTNGGFDDDECN